MYSLFSNDFSVSVSGSACNVQSIGFYATLLDLAISLIGEGMPVLWFLAEGQMSDGKRSAYVLCKSKELSMLVSKIFRTYDFSNSSSHRVAMFFRFRSAVYATYCCSTSVAQADHAQPLRRSHDSIR